MSQSLATSPNHAVDRCLAAYHETYQAARADGKSATSASFAADDAYRRAMPRLDTRDDIRAFIACVAHGLLLDIVHRTDGPRLLAAARAAAAALPREFRPAGRPATLSEAS